MQKVTAPALRAQGAKRFAWVKPGELTGLALHGSFIYTTADSPSDLDASDSVCCELRSEPHANRDIEKETPLKQDRDFERLVQSVCSKDGAPDSAGLVPRGAPPAEGFGAPRSPGAAAVWQANVRTLVVDYLQPRLQLDAEYRAKAVEKMFHVIERISDKHYEDKKQEPDHQYATNPVVWQLIHTPITGDAGESDGTALRRAVEMNDLHLTKLMLAHDPDLRDTFSSHTTKASRLQ